MKISKINIGLIFSNFEDQNRDGLSRLEAFLGRCVNFKFQIDGGYYNDLLLSFPNKNYNDLLYFIYFFFQHYCNLFINTIFKLLFFLKDTDNTSI